MDPKFVVDLNVGRLAKWLRAMGYDTLYVPEVEDGALVRIAQQESRVILTRDRLLLERRSVVRGHVRALLVQGDHYVDQLRQVSSHLGLQLDNPFSRCIECNALLSGLPRERAGGRVPPYVFATQGEFKECPLCSKVYWRGTHWDNMRRELGRASGAEGGDTGIGGFYGIG
ncbi:MAG: Mut7-C RNAse domain-containing protein [Chloroflexi bacterium]|nr:Mut7-C RNAse domain-containing protein [Chloroflexota bacterium]